MAGIDDPFTPGPTVDPSAGVEPGTYDKVRGQWEAFMGNPQGRAALLSAGLALMQPPSFGDTPTAQIGRAIGAAGQSATANQAMDIKESEASSKQELRGSQATLAEARAQTAGAHASAAADRLQFQRERLAQEDRLKRIGLGIQAHNAYNKYRTSVTNANLLAGPGKEIPLQSFEEFVAANPTFRDAATSDEAAIPPGVPTTTSKGGGGAIPPGAVEALKADPSLKAQFEAKYGKGSAARVLGESGG